MKNLTEKLNDYPREQLLDIIDELTYEKEHLERELKHLSADLQDNYRPLTHQEQCL